MADSVALDIQQAIEARLKLVSVSLNGVVHTKPTGLVVERERIGPIMPKNVKDGPLLVIHMGGQQPTTRKHYASPMLNRVLHILITIAADANTLKNSEALDPATNWLVVALQSEPTMGGIAHWISEEGQDDFYSFFDESADVVAIREIKLHVAFHTRTDNPTARS